MSSSPAYAKCENCPLKAYWEERGEMGYSNGGFAPVRFKHYPKTRTMIIGPGPEKQDVDFGQPFTGPNGVKTMELFGRPRASVSWGNIVLCRWPEDDPVKFLTKLRARNKRKSSKNSSSKISQTPQQCCAPQIRWELRDYKNLIILGPLTAKALIQDREFGLIRGAPQLVPLNAAYASTDQPLKVLVTHTAVKTSREPKWKKIVARDFAKAVRHFTGTLRWTDPEIISVPTPQKFATWAREQAAAAASGSKVHLVFDTETSIAHFTKRILYTVQIGALIDNKVSKVWIIPFNSKEGKVYYTDEEVEQLVEEFRMLFVHPRIIIIGHNSGYFDRIVVEEFFGVTPSPILDTILVHHLSDSEYRHTLAFISSVELDVPAWKADHAGTVARTDEELFTYGGTDVAATGANVGPLVRRMQTRKQSHLYAVDAKMQEYCVGMKRLGMRIDEGRRLKHLKEQEDKSREWLSKVHKLVPGLNPRSPQQMSRLLFDKWGLPVQELTDTGAPSSNAATLRALFTSPLVDEDQKEFLRAVRLYRKAEKILSTYLRKWGPNSPEVVDGYINWDYSAHTVVTGRLSSPSQQIPYLIRDIFIPPPGCVFVDADVDQIELRFASALAHAEVYLNAFRLPHDHPDAIDPHNLTGSLMFGDMYWKVPGAPELKIGKGEGRFKNLRDLAKTICFASLYGAGALKVFELVMKDEEKEDDPERGVFAGDLTFGEYTFDQVRALWQEWTARAPEFKRWWDQTINTYRKHRYLEEPINRRRRYFHKEAYNEILNFRVQAGSFALVANAMIQMIEHHLPFNYVEKTGLCQQLHDAVLFSAKEAKASDTAEIISQCITQDALGLKFTAEAKVGYSWKEV